MNVAMTWKLNALLGKCKDKGQPITYRDLSTATGLSTSTIYLIAQNKTNRADLGTIEAMLKFFSEKLGEKLKVDDVLAWEDGATDGDQMIRS